LNATSFSGASSLAPVIVEALTAVLLRVRDESALSIVLVEQNSRVALAFSPRTVVMDKGCIASPGSSASPYKRSPRRQVARRSGWPIAFQPECPLFMYLASNPASRSLIAVLQPTWKP
jgi:ABC-type sulfate/molybdate transport systems ATPase subunit